MRDDLRHDDPTAAAHARCFTLLETIVVVVLLSLAMIIMMGAVARGGTEGKLSSTAKEILDLDRRARLLSATAGAMILGRRGENHALTLIDADSRRQVAAATPPHGVEVVLIDARSSLAVPEIGIGADGRSPDYVVMVRVGSSGQASSNASRRYRVAGLTGFVTQEAAQ